MGVVVVVVGVVVVVDVVVDVVVVVVLVVVVDVVVVSHVMANVESLALPFTFFPSSILNDKTQYIKVEDTLSIAHKAIELIYGAKK